MLILNEELHLYPDGFEDNLLNPSVVFEVYSPSTEAYDRGEKFAYYRRIASLQAYLLVSQNRTRVECFTRQDTDQWLLTEFSGLEAIVSLEMIGGSLPLSEVYGGITFPESNDGGFSRGASYCL